MKRLLPAQLVVEANGIKVLVAAELEVNSDSFELCNYCTVSIRPVTILVDKNGECVRIDLD